MRWPHKKVLVFGLDLDELGALSYVMRVRLYDVTLVVSGQAAMTAIAQYNFDCAVVLGNHGAAIAEAVVTALNGARPEMPIVLSVPKNTETSSAATVVCHGMETARMLEYVRLLVKRRRGPKKPGEMRVPMGAIGFDGMQRAG